MNELPRPVGPGGTDPSASSAALRLAVLGPSRSAGDPIRTHVHTLAHELAEAGHDVTHLHPGREDRVASAPGLRLARPDQWVAAGRSLSGVDAILVVLDSAAALPAHLAVVRAARAGDAGGPRLLVLAHPAAPLPSGAPGRALARALLTRADAVVTHDESAARTAAALGAAHVHRLALPPPQEPGGPILDPVTGDGRTRVLALGAVREDKGIDLLLDAAREVPGVTVTVAGEMWGEAGRRVGLIATDPVLRGRVDVGGGYVPTDRLPELLARHDVLALTYRQARPSHLVRLARRHGLPVLASAVGSFPEEVWDGVDGLLVPPGDVDAIRRALALLADPAYAAQLRASVRPPDESGPWAHYVGAIEALASGELGVARTVPRRPLPSRAGTSAVATSVRTGVDTARAHLRRREVLVLRPADLPESLRASDVLTADRDAVVARELAQSLGLPRCRDAVAAWAALGALAAILRIGDRDGRRDAVIVDESGPRSPLSRWVRSLGFVPVELDLTRSDGRGAEPDVDLASLDVLARLHPGGCGAEDIDHTLSQASWALRTGGLLVVTLPLGTDDPDWALTPADIRGVLARAGDLGLTLVGDLDGDLLARMRAPRPSAAEAAKHPSRSSSAYGILRLTFRRR
ncbi:MAG: glycosyltransferase family 4 protein [Actinobacteria bacterium]|nr:glycosyltransferase family 4 protein [Actinomycetota bacterium]